MRDGGGDMRGEGGCVVGKATGMHSCSKQF